MGSPLFNFSRRATRDADIMEIQKYHGRTDGPTDGRTGAGARDTCVSKTVFFLPDTRFTAFITYALGEHDPGSAQDWRTSNDFRTI